MYFLKSAWAYYLDSWLSGKQRQIKGVSLGNRPRNRMETIKTVDFTYTSICRIPFGDWEACACICLIIVKITCKKTKEKGWTRHNLLHVNWWLLYSVMCVVVKDGQGWQRRLAKESSKMGSFQGVQLVALDNNFKPGNIWQMSQMIK